MAALTVLMIVAALTVGLGVLPTPPDECPRAVLSCERGAAGEAEYVCTATANQPSADDVPEYSWELSAGRIVGDRKAPHVTVDARGVKSDTLTVTLKVRWPKSPAGCEASEEKRLRLRQAP